MPQAVAAAVAFVGGWGAAASLVVGIASGVYSYTQMKKAKDLAGEQGQAERKQILRSSSAPKNYIYGKNRSSGLLMFAQEEDVGGKADGEYVHLLITDAGHEIHSSTKIKFNDEPIENFAGYCEVQTYPKGRTTADPFLLDRCKDFDDTMIGKGFAWSRYALKFNQEKFPNGIPNITSLKMGFEIEDIRDGSVAWSDNPALCILHYLRLKGWEDEFLILDSFKQAANICDEIVTNPDGTNEKRYRIGCEFRDSDTPASVLDKMLASCGGEWIRVGGRIGLSVGAYAGAPSVEITEDELIGSVDIQVELEREDSFNVVHGTYIDPEQDYTEVDYPPVKVAEWIAEDGEEITMDMDLDYVQSPWQAQRLADIALKRARLGMTMKLPCNMRGFQCTPGTMISLSMPTIGFKKSDFKVIDWEFSVDNGVTLVVRRELPEMYDDAIGEQVTAPPLLDLPLSGVPAPTNPVYSAKPVGDIVQGVLSWTNTSFKLSHTNVIIKDKAGFVIQSVQVPFPGNEMELNGKLSGSYDIELSAVAVNGSKSTVTKMTITISEPVTPDLISVKASNWSIQLIPQYTTQAVPFGTLFEFYVSETDSAIPPDRKPDEVASSWNQGGLIPDTLYYYWIRAVNSYGKSGWAKKAVRTTKESALVETLVEKLVGIEIYAPLIASDDSGNPKFILDGRPDHGNGLIKGANIVGSEFTSDNYVAGREGFKLSRDSAEFNSNVDINASIRADQIIGDIVSAASYGINEFVSSNGSTEILSFGINNQNNNKSTLTVEVPEAIAYIVRHPGSTHTAEKYRFDSRMRLLRDGVIVSEKSKVITLLLTGAPTSIEQKITFDGVSDIIKSNSIGVYNYSLQLYTSIVKIDGYGEVNVGVKTIPSSVNAQFFVNGNAFI